MRVTAILASHNRRSRTLACLDSYYGQEVAESIELEAVLVDGGSVDGTVSAVRRTFPQARVIVGGEDLYWAGAMAVAERAAIVDDPDHLLWLNDDVVLDPESLDRLVAVAETIEGGCIAVGALRDPESGGLTYSGVERTGWHPLRMRWIEPADRPVDVETFNGNVVLVPRAVRARVGALDGALVHSAADFDYGLRAREVGVRNVLVPRTVGTCARDGGRRPWLDQSVPLRERVELFLGPKGVPPGPRARYLRRHGGPAWPLFWAFPYVCGLPPLLLPSRASLRAR